MNIVNYFAQRQYVKKLLNDEENVVIKKFYFCNNCKQCEKFYPIRSESKRKDFWTFNKYIKYWDVRDPSFNESNRKFEIRPIRDSRFRMQSSSMISRRIFELFWHQKSSIKDPNTFNAVIPA